MTNSERKEYNIDRTIDMALECFQEMGIEATTQGILAKKVRLTTKTIQRYFQSKDDIILLAMKRLNEHYYELIEQQLAKIDLNTLSGLEQLIAFFEAHQVFFDSKNRILLLMTEMHLYLIRHNIPENQILRQIEATSPHLKRILRSLERGVEDGSIRNDIDVKLMYAFLTTSFAGMIQRMMMFPNTYDKKRNGIDKTDILALYIHGIRSDLKAK